MAVLWSLTGAAVLLSLLQENNLEKSEGTWHIMSPRLKKWGGHVPCVPHRIAPMN